jgi:hypothetical protein
MKNIWRKHKEYILVLAYIAVLFALFCFVIKPMVKGIDYNANLIQEKITIQENFKKKLGMISTDKEQIGAVERDENKIGVLISPDQEVTLIEKIEKIAEETNNKISIEAVDDKNANSGAGAKTAPAKAGDSKDDLKINPDNNDYVKFRITVLGNYNDLIGFIKKIENMEYWSDIASLQISYKEPEKTSISPENLADSTGLYGSVSEETNVTSVTIEEGKTSSILEIIFYLSGKI